MVRSVESLAGRMMTAANMAASSTQETSMPRYGQSPVRASPARRFGDRLKAGPIALRNSCHGEGHSTRNLGTSFTRAWLHSNLELVSYGGSGFG
jgi:hypothetical protein